jgi:uncharacterized membrane protein
MRPPWEELEPASRGAVERQRHAARRVEQLATVVLAAAMALVVVLLINHTVSSIPAHGTLSQALRAAWPAAGASAMGLLVLLSCWFLHHLQFHYLTRSSGWLLLIHALLLTAALFVPFSTALLNTLSLTRQALLLFEGNVLIMQVLLLLTWRHAVKAGLLFGSDVPRRVVVRLRTMLRSGVAATLVICMLAFVSTTISVGALVTLMVAQMALIVKGGYTLDLRPGTARATGD